MIDSQRKMRYNKDEVITMEKTMTLNLRVNPTVKQQAEDVLKQLGIPMATAIDMYLRQITLTGGIPFSLSLPKAPAALNADTMTDDQLHAALQVGIKELASHKIYSRKYFYPLTNEFQCYQGRFSGEQTPVAKYVADRVLTLPMYADLAMEDVDRICGLLKEIK